VPSFDLDALALCRCSHLISFCAQAGSAKPLKS
jgi:hypothetical protein